MSKPKSITFLLASALLWPLPSRSQYSPGVITSVLSYGATGNGTTDDTPALQAAHHAVCVAGGGTVYYPPGVYLITPVAGALAGTFQVCSSMTITMSPGALVRVKPNAGNYFALFMAAPLSAAVNNFQMSGGAIDQNEVNNTTATVSVGASTSTAQNVLAIYSGAGIQVSGMTFLNSGINTIVANGPSVSGVNVSNNRFIFSVNSTQPPFDNSAVYLSATDFIISGNRFTTAHAAISDLAGTAIEVHIGTGTISGNNVQWYAGGGNVVDTTEVTVSGNTISNAGSGFTLWAVNGTNLNSFIGNIISLDQLDRAAGTSQGIAMAFGAGTTGNHSNLVISHNTIISQLETTARVVASPNSYWAIGTLCLGNVANVNVVGNLIVNAPIRGIELGENSATYTLSQAWVTNNQLVNSGTNPQYAGSYAQAIAMTGNLQNVFVMNNAVTFTATPPTYWAQSFQVGFTYSGVYFVQNAMTSASGSPTTSLTSGVMLTL
jgi:hypothetical protein